jgi:hypothetical protein
MRPFADARQERAYGQSVALRRIPFDIVLGTVWLVAFVAHAHFVLEGLVAGCASGGPGWFQGSALSHRWRQQGAAAGSAAAAVALPAQLLQPPYPCGAPLPARLAHAAAHWRQLTAAALASPDARVVLLDPGFLAFNAAGLVHLLVLGLAALAVKWQGRWRVDTPAGGGSPDAGARQQQRGEGGGGGSRARSSAGGGAAAASAPDWLVALRGWCTAALLVCSSYLQLAGQLLWPVPARLLPFTLRYIHSSAAGNYFWAVLPVVYTGAVVGCPAGTKLPACLGACLACCCMRL